uniref:Uncharacterized protein n=1 Tax=Arundo donax TaxID=35708 RepID=A0A0A8YIM0_ARUDO
MVNKLEGYMKQDKSTMSMPQNSQESNISICLEPD